jgi:hypothetical protein
LELERYPSSKRYLEEYPSSTGYLEESPSYERYFLGVALIIK